MAPPYISPSPEAAGQALVKLRESRGEQRDPVFGPGTLTWDDGSESQEVDVEVLNMSDHGAQVVAPDSLSVGSPAYLTGEEFRCVGHVRYYKIDPRGFLVGLKFSQTPIFKGSLFGL